MSADAEAREDDLRRVFDALERGDMATVLSVAAPDLTLHVPPGLPWSPAELRGPDAILGLIQQMLSWTDGQFKTTVTSVASGTSMVTSVNRVTSTRNGETRDYETVWVWRLADNVVREAWLHSSLSDEELGRFYG